jgi:hypothetical protein
MYSEKRACWPRSAVLSCGLLFLSAVAQAKVLLTPEEALRSVYPGCTARAETHYLSADEVKEASSRAGSVIASAVVIRYVIGCPAAAGGGTSASGARPGGYAYTDTHRVRTHPETLLVALDGEGRILRIEVLSFDEPSEYLPKPQWYRTFDHQKLDSNLALKRAIPLVTGASLTSRATTEAARRALALHEVLAAVKKK